MGGDKPDGYVLVNFDDDTNNKNAATTLYVYSADKTGPVGLVNDLLDDQVQYGVLRISNLPPVRGKTFRDVFLVWVGPKVSKADRALKSSAAYIKDIKKQLSPFDAEVTILSKSKLNRESLLVATSPQATSNVIS